MSLTKVINSMIDTVSITLSPFTMSTAKILGRSTAGTGAIEEITVGTGLSLTGGTLAATGGGVTSFNTRTGAITLTTADVNNTIVTGNVVGAVHLAGSEAYYGAGLGFTVGTSYSCSAGLIQGGTDYATVRTNGSTILSVTGTWKCLDIVRNPDTLWDRSEDKNEEKNQYIYRFMRIA